MRLAMIIAGAAALLLTSPVTSLASVVTGPSRTSPITIENERPGTNLWKLKHSPVSDDRHNQIKGYADRVSVPAGQRIRFKVTVNPAQTFTLTIYRIGWYQGKGGREMRSAGPMRGVTQPSCPPTGPTRLVMCDWSTSYGMFVPRGWLSGEYLVKLRNAAGYVNWIPFVVRDDASHSAFLFQSSVNTWEAYNGWGGTSLYGYRATRAHEVSFDRPYEHEGAPFAVREIQMVRFLESKGYDVTYSTDVDTDVHPERLLNHRALLVVGHDEYWSWGMRDAVEGARDHGVNIGFFGANDSFWQIRYAHDAAGAGHRVIIAYKEDYAADPNYASRDPAIRERTTAEWRASVVGRPEQLLTGEMYAGNVGTDRRDTDFIVDHSGSWPYAGISVEDGTHATRLVGNEFDNFSRAYPSPKHTWRLVVGRSRIAGTVSKAQIYQAPSGALVFDAGTISWDWGLDDLGMHRCVSPIIQTLTTNVLDRFQS